MPARTHDDLFAMLESIAAPIAGMARSYSGNP